jgi:hypothetical protein
MPIEAVEIVFGAEIGVGPVGLVLAEAPAAGVLPEPDGAQGLLLPKASPATTQGVVSVLISTLLPAG